MTTVYVMVNNYSDGYQGWDSSAIEYPIFSSVEKLREWFLENFFQYDIKEHDGHEFYFYAIPVDKPFDVGEKSDAIIVDSVLPGYECPDWFLSEFDELGHRIDWEKV